ncbi:hypothetical protein [uncultured Faecalicoccus sp.]|uniref:hypothetical protein n=1 Tax=uncultured Faecalicoccus sp. TaxID=1971760 RepID=UPI00261DA702|nr:hypothetical protein [uncultured Faecalicoccus sp.]
MYNREDLFINDQSCINIGLYPAELPGISVPARQYNETTIPGRDGIFYEDLETFDDINQSVKFNFRARKGQTVDTSFRQYRRFLRNAKTYAKQSDPTVFYKIKKVTIGDLSRGTSFTIGTFDCEFVLAPYAYLQTGAVEYPIQKVVNNPFDVCHPIYILKGNGSCNLIINGKSMKCNVSGKLFIDTELRLAYRSNGEWVNSSVSGNYEDLYLQSGLNSIKVTNSSILLRVIPNWRYEP